MNTYRFATVVGLLLVAGILTGCLVSPGEVDPDLLYQYQQRTVLMGPPARTNELLAVPGSTGAPLPMRVDPQTGAKLVELSLQQVLYRTLANSLDIKVTGYDPAIARQDVIAAAAAFDYIVFGSVAWDKTDSLSLSDISRQQSETLRAQAGVRRPLPTGGEASVAYQVTRIDNEILRNRLPFNPAYEQTLAFQLTQPLLRNFGPDVNLAQLRVARLNHSISLAQFHARVLDVLTEVQAQYWQLARAREDLQIQQRLLEETERTLELVRQRLPLDASRVQLSQTEAAVASRRAALIRARNEIQDVQDSLVRLMADSSLSLVDDLVIVPTTPLASEAVVLDRGDLIATALKYSPELAQARLAISIGNIQVRVARNQLLPRLDLQAGVDVSGVDDGFGSSFNELDDHDYIDYSLVALFEYPLGNRAAKAVLRQSRLRRMQSVVTLQNTADQVALSVNEAVREVAASLDEMRAQRETLEANREYLQAIKDRQEFRGALNPEFLELRLRAEEQISAAARSLLLATVNYNIAQLNLARITGTSLRMAGVVISDAEMADFFEMLAERVELPAGMVARQAEAMPLGPATVVPMTPATQTAPAPEAGAPEAIVWPEPQDQPQILLPEASATAPAAE